jgi:hypothetical protein
VKGIHVKRVRWATAVLPLFLLTALLQGCGSTVDVASNWSNSAVVIDGKADDWSSLQPIKDSPVLLGMRNDQDYLYLCLESSDRQFRQQLLGLGMTIWFEPKGGDKIGIHYPLGRGRMGPGAGYGAPGGEIPAGGPPDGGPAEVDGPGAEKGGNTPEIVKELEILGPGKNDVDRMPLIQAAGIEIQIGHSGGTIVYELKVPLQKSAKHPNGIAARPGSKVDVNFETGKFTPPENKSGSGMSGGGEGTGGGGYPGGGQGGGMGPPPGGMGPVDGGEPPGGGMPGGGMGGGQRGGRGSEGGYGGRKSEPKQFSLETEVTLASGPVNSTTR